MFNSKAMSNNTTYPPSCLKNISVVCDLEDHGGQEGPYSFVASFASAVFIAIFSPVAVTEWADFGGDLEKNKIFCVENL